MRMTTLVPGPARRMARRYHQWLAFRRALQRSSGRVENGDLPSAEIAALSYGWGNEGFSGDDAFLTAVVRYAAEAPGAVLECGSGLSTILLAIATRARGTRVVSLENHPGWAERVQRWMPQGNEVQACVHVAPLRSYGDFDWYAPAFDAMPPAFSLVVCDGPPGDTRGGRYGLVPVMRKLFSPGCVILLDDANREAERTTAARWAEDLGAALTIHGTDARAFATLTLPS